MWWEVEGGLGGGEVLGLMREGGRNWAGGERPGALAWLATLVTLAGLDVLSLPWSLSITF